MKDTIRLSLDVSPALHETLTVLAQKVHGTKSDVLRMAITLMEVVVQAKAEGRRVGIAAADEVLETEIVGLVVR
jgi:hypothetical protein